MYTRKAHETREAPKRGQINDQPEAREGQAGRPGVAERFVVPLKPGNAGGGKGPQFKTDAIRSEGPGDWAAYQLRRVFQKLQMALHAKAKAEAGYRFYALYDKISREDILAHAYAQCRSNKGAPGVDGQVFADIEAYGVQRWLGELALALRQETYRPEPIRRVFIPKANGKLRPLGISTLRDRVCMTAAMLVLEPIFEADLPPEQYAYRPGRNAQQAVVKVDGLLFRGHPEVVDADLADYFGSIPHIELLKSVARRIVDRRVLHLIKMWLECPVEETDDRGRKTRTTEARDNRRGIPQGSPISPLLANIYMRRFVLGWKKLGLEQRLGSRIVTYADDRVPRTHRRKKVRNCVRDGGRSSGAGRQGQASNHRKLRRSKAGVVSVAEKAGLDPVRYGSERRARANR